LAAFLASLQSAAPPGDGGVCPLAPTTPAAATTAVNITARDLFIEAFETTLIIPHQTQLAEQFGRGETPGPSKRPKKTAQSERASDQLQMQCGAVKLHGRVAAKILFFLVIWVVSFLLGRRSV
jgi:hypothetical protein